MGHGLNPEQLRQELLEYGRKQHRPAVEINGVAQLAEKLTQTPRRFLLPSERLRIRVLEECTRRQAEQQSNPPKSILKRIISGLRRH